MGINSILTPEDLSKDKPVEPGWYPAEITKYSEELTKDKPERKSDGSTNAIFQLTILDGPLGTKGRVMNRYFNEKALGFGKNLWAVLFPEFDKEKGMPAGKALTSEMFRSAVGRKIEVYLKMDGKYPNVEDYRPLTVKK